MKTTAVTIMLALAMTGCVSTQEIAASSDYRLCRAQVLRPMMLGSSGLAEVDKQIMSRNIDCSPHMAAIMQERSSRDAASQRLADDARSRDKQDAEDRRAAMEQHNRAVERSRQINCTSYKQGANINTTCQ